MKRTAEILVVGAGTAGSAIARNLGPRCSLRVLERAAGAVPVLYRIPLLIGILYNKGSDYIRQLFVSGPLGRKLPIYMPKSIGGASMINGCVHVLGSITVWKKILSRHNFSEDQFWDSYTSIFSRNITIGRIKLSEKRPSRLDELFRRSLERIGITKTDILMTDSVGFGSIVNTAGRYLRSSVLDLKPFECSVLLSGIEVQRLAVDDTGNIVGVYDGSKFHTCDKLILAAGVLDTNKLLLRKAIRITDNALTDLDIPAGCGVRDHTNLRINVACNTPIGSLNEIAGNFILQCQLISNHLTGLPSSMKGTGATTGLNLDLDGDGVIDTRINLLEFFENGRMGSSGKLFSTNEPGFSFSITHINPRSIGAITIENDLDVDLDPGYLRDSYDVTHLSKAIDFVLSVLETDPISKIVKEIESLDLLMQNRELYIRENIYSGYHLIGGCKHLVDDHFRLQGFGNVYVCDSSIFDEYPSSNIHSSVVLIADLFARRLALTLS